MTWEGTEELRRELRVNSLRFSRRADELFLKASNETAWSESPVCEERGNKVENKYLCLYGQQRMKMFVGFQLESPD